MMIGSSEKKSQRDNINMSHTIQSCQIRINVSQYIPPCFVMASDITTLFGKKKRKKKIQPTKHNQQKKLLFFTFLKSLPFEIDVFS